MLAGFGFEGYADDGTSESKREGVGVDACMCAKSERKREREREGCVHVCSLFQCTDGRMDVWMNGTLRRGDNSTLQHTSACVTYLSSSFKPHSRGRVEWREQHGHRRLRDRLQHRRSLQGLEQGCVHAFHGCLWMCIWVDGGRGKDVWM